METPEIAEIPEPRYPTLWGSLTFTELFERTHRYAKYLLCCNFPANTNDPEDGLQVGYLKLWQRLQHEPEFLAGRKPGWIARHVVYAALHVRHREYTLRQRIRENSEDDDFNDLVMSGGSGSFRAHSSETRQADKRLDLHAAIAATATDILAQPPGRAREVRLWALYGLTILQVSALETSRLFRMRERTMCAAYDEVRQMLRERLEGYAPHGATRRVWQRGQQPLPWQDITAIRAQNTGIPPERYEQVRQLLEVQQADTLERDLIALDGIRAGSAAREQARASQLTYAAMQRAYTRVHLLLAAQVDTTVTPRRPEKKNVPQTTLTPAHEPALQQMTAEILSSPRSQERLVALYAYICNLPGRTTARQFNMEEAVIRRYRKQIHQRFTGLISGESQHENRMNPPHFSGITGD